MKIVKKKAKTIFTKTSLGCDYTINQYVGCGHQCLYCYARFMERFKGYGQWGAWIEVKENAPQLVRGEYVEGSVWMSSVSDPYQPIEKELKLTKGVLENMDKRISLAVQSKSGLVLRDIDLFKEFEDIEVGLTINGFEPGIKKVFEPYSANHQKRLNALKILKEGRIKTYAFISPIIPGLVNIKQCVQESRDFVDYYWFEVLNLKGAGKEFQNLLKEKFPESYEIMINKEKFLKFTNKLKQDIKNANIKSAGIVIH